MTPTSDELASRLPNFFLIGAAKAGTTTLYHLFRQHPDVFLPRRKEPHFFDNDANYAAGIERYVGLHYARAAGKPARGDATPSYLHLAAKVAPRLAAAYAGRTPRFIAVLRDPVQRAYSHYRDRVRGGGESEPFGVALAQERERLSADPDAWVGYYRDGLYATHLETYFRYFDRASFHIVRYEDMARDTSAVARKIFAFLGVEPDAPIDAGQAHNVAAVPRSVWLRDAIARPASWKRIVKAVVPDGPRRDLKMWLLRQSLRSAPNPPIPPEVERELRARYADEIDRLEALLGWDLAAWRQGSTRQADR